MPLTQEEKNKRITDLGLDPSEYDIEEKSTSQSPLKTFGQHALEAAPSSLSGLLGGAAGVAAIPLLGAAAGATAPVTLPLALALGAGYGMHKLQNYLQTKVRGEQGASDYYKSLEEGAAQNPKAAYAGDIAPNLAGLYPTVSGARTLGSALSTLSRAKGVKLDPSQLAALQNAAVGGALPIGTTILPKLAAGELPDLKDLAEVGLGGLSTQPTPLGRGLGYHIPLVHTPLETPSVKGTPSGATPSPQVETPVTEPLVPFSSKAKPYGVHSEGEVKSIEAQLEDNPELQKQFKQWAGNVKVDEATKTPQGYKYYQPESPLSEGPSKDTSKKLSNEDVMYKGWQEGSGSQEGDFLFNLQRDLSPELVKNSTVSRASLREAGYKIDPEVFRLASRPDIQAIGSREGFRRGVTTEQDPTLTAPEGKPAEGAQDTSARRTILGLDPSTDTLFHEQFHQMQADLKNSPRKEDQHLYKQLEDLGLEPTAEKGGLEGFRRAELELKGDKLAKFKDWYSDAFNATKARLGFKENVLQTASARARYDAPYSGPSTSQPGAVYTSIDEPRVNPKVNEIISNEKNLTNKELIDSLESLQIESPATIDSYHARNNEGKGDKVREDILNTLKNNLQYQDKSLLREDQARDIGGGKFEVKMPTINAEGLQSSIIDFRDSGSNYNNYFNWLSELRNSPNPPPKEWLDRKIEEMTQRIRDLQYQEKSLLRENNPDLYEHLSNTVAKDSSGNPSLLYAAAHKDKPYMDVSNSSMLGVRLEKDATNLTPQDYGPGPANTRPVYANITKPARIDEVDFWSAPEVRKELRNKGILTDEDFKNLPEKAINKPMAEIRYALKQKGYDGLVFSNKKGEDSYIAFEGYQMPSALVPEKRTSKKGEDYWFQEESKLREPVTFKTEKGSTYVVNENGTTTRNKALRSEHPGDQGIKAASEKTIYLDDLAANSLAPPMASHRVIDHADGTVSLATKNKDGRWGISPSAKNIKYSTEPKIGNIPLELWKKEAIAGLDAYGSLHFGNKIVEMGGNKYFQAESKLREDQSPQEAKINIPAFIDAKDPITIPGVRPAIDALRAVGSPEAKYIAPKLAEQMARNRANIKWPNVGKAIVKNVSRVDGSNLQNLLLEESRTGKSLSNTIQDPQILSAYHKLREWRRAQIEDMVNSDHPEVSFDTKGKKVFNFPDPNSLSWPSVISLDVINTLNNKPNSPEAQAYEYDFLSKLNDTELPGEDNAIKRKERFDDLRKSFGKNYKEPDNLGRIQAPRDLPDSWIEHNFDRALERIGRRFANARAFHDVIAVDPLAAHLLGMEKDQWGQPIKHSETLSPINNNQLVQGILEFVGDRFIDSTFGAISQAAGGIIRAGMMQTETGLINLATDPFIMMGHSTAAQLPGMIYHGLADIKQGIIDSFRTGISTRQITSREDLLRVQGNLAEKLGYLRNGINLISTREHLERFSRGLSMSMATYLADSNVALAQSGNQKALSKISRFMGDRTDILLDSTHSQHEEMKLELAARITEATQGTYDPRTLPLIALKGEWQPLFTLSKWNIGQLNSFMKHIVSPAIQEGRVEPLFMATLGGLLGGSLISWMKEDISGRKDKYPTWNEIMHSTKGFENTSAILYKLAGMASLSGYAGLLGSTISDFANLMRGNSVQGLSMPSVEFFQDILKDTMYGIKNLLTGGEDFFDVSGKLITNLTKSHLQMVRVAMNHYNKEETELAGRKRDLRVFNQLEGFDTPNFSFGSFNGDPYSNLKEKAFHKETDLSKAQEMIPGVVEHAALASQGHEGVYHKKLEALKDTPYQIIPSPSVLDNKEQFLKYMQWIVETQGVEQATKLAQDYDNRKLIDKEKFRLVQQYLQSKAASQQ